MTNPFLADLLMILHFLWVAFMILGLPLGLFFRSPALRWTHFIGMSVTAFFAISGFFCPLTVWEEELRGRAVPGFGSSGSFLANHLSAVLYPAVEAWVTRAASAIWGGITLLAMVLLPPGLRR